MHAYDSSQIRDFHMKQSNVFYWRLTSTNCQISFRHEKALRIFKICLTLLYMLGDVMVYTIIDSSSWPISAQEISQLWFKTYWCLYDKDVNKEQFYCIKLSCREDYKTKSLKIYFLPLCKAHRKHPCKFHIGRSLSPLCHTQCSLHIAKCECSSISLEGTCT